MNTLEKIYVSNKKLFCNACREEVGIKCSVIANHVKSNKHKLGKERLLSKEATERDIASCFESSSLEQHPRGETLSAEHRVYHIKVLRVFLRSATPLSKLCHFRGLLEENAYRLPDRRLMADLIPFVLNQELELIKKEISDKFVSVVFNGTTRLGEAMAIIIRFVDSEWIVQQRLVCMRMLSKSLTGEEIAQVLIDTLSRKCGISSEYCLACMRDRASCNNVAVSLLKVIFPNVMDIGCFSHTLNLVGEKVKAPILHEFMLHWLSLLCLGGRSPGGNTVVVVCVSVCLSSLFPHNG